MKIKDVIKETGLTDRAIRLYMENDLIKPEYDENYNGRKSIDFSENDVLQLKNIATLRKADFSIQEIKSLQSGGETAQQTVKEYIKRTNEKIQFNTEIIEKIGTLADEENITIEIICEKLSTNLADEKVPIEDMELPPKEKIKRAICMTISIFGMTISLLAILVCIFYYKNLYFYPEFYEDFYKTIPDRMFFWIQFLICLVLLLLVRKQNKVTKMKKRMASVLVVIWAVSMLAFPVKLVTSLFTPPVYSLTTNPAHYLCLEDFIYCDNTWREQIFYFFPAVIPDSAINSNYDSYYLDYEDFPSTTKYYYRYETSLETNFDIFAEWQLPNDEYLAEKERVLAKGGITSVEQKGDWQCVYFFDTDFKSLYVFFFAYNDSTQTVRYIAMYDIESLIVPYYTTQEW